MQNDILTLFRRNPGEYLSGEDISRQLHVSRTAVWKHIKALKEQGYNIEAHTKLGYCLRSAPDLLLPAEIRAKLSTKLIAAESRHIRYFATVDSTNNVAKILAGEGCPEGTIVVAEAQDGGRGRLARGWFSPQGKGVWVSVILRPLFLPQDAPKCTLLAAVAVNRAVSKVTGLECGIKWPNDLLWQGKKFVGILTEMSAEMDMINYVVIGMGINVNLEEDDLLPELRTMATSLAMMQGLKVSRLELLVALLEELEELYFIASTLGFAPILAQWRKLSVTLGQKVDVLAPDRKFSGVAVDIDAEGALLVRTDTGLVKVLAGDVSIRTV